ncbi:hypothetical protein Sango_1467600, partial [Sesamum angolense]
APHPILERLDRVCGNDNWQFQFPHTQVKYLSSIYSDHVPVLVELSQVTSQDERFVRPFQFEASWIKNAYSEKIIAESWSCIRGFSSHDQFQRNIEACRSKLLAKKSIGCGWIKRDIGKIEKKIEHLRKQTITLETRTTENNLKTKLEDYTTPRKYFGSNGQNLIGLKKGIGTRVSFRPMPAKPSIGIKSNVLKIRRGGGLIRNRILLKLLKPYTPEEITAAITHMAPLKSPGPDEINHFLKNKSWGKSGHMALKLDISKAYDKVEWSFLGKVYGKASGQEINYHKSVVVFRKNTPEAFMSTISEGLRIRKADRYDKYLGLPSVVGRSKKAMCFGLNISLVPQFLMQIWVLDLRSLSLASSHPRSSFEQVPAGALEMGVQLESRLTRGSRGCHRSAHVMQSVHRCLVLQFVTSLALLLAIGMCPYSHIFSIMMTSAYHLVMAESRKHKPQSFSSDDRALRNDWQGVWNSKVPNKIRVFAWWLGTDSSPLGANLVKRIQGLMLFAHFDRRRRNPIGIPSFSVLSLGCLGFIRLALGYYLQLDHKCLGLVVSCSQGVRSLRVQLVLDYLLVYLVESKQTMDNK